MDFNTGYNFINDDETKLHGLHCPPMENRTQQQFAEEADINTLVARFGLTGEIPPDLRMPQYPDITEMQADFHTALTFVRDTQQEFLRVPANIRARFRNDPGELLAFLNDTNNKAEAMELGLIPKPPEQTRDTITPAPSTGAQPEPKK